MISVDAVKQIAARWQPAEGLRFIAGPPIT
jgi:hypothetical protein